MEPRSNFRAPTTAEIVQASVDVARALADFGSGPSPLIRCPDTEDPIWLKREDQLPTGSFKFRAAVAVVAHALRNRDHHLVIATSGSFGQAMAAVASKYGLRLTVFTSESTSSVKLARMAQDGIDVHRVGGRFEDAVYAAHGFANANGVRYVSPDNDALAIAGSASLYFELLEQGGGGAVMVPYIGGGAMAGLGLAKQLTGADLPLAGVIVDADGNRSSYSAGHLPTYKRKPNQPHLVDDFDVFVEPGNTVQPILGEWVHTQGVSVADVEDAAFDLFTKTGITAEAPGAAAIAAAWANARDDWGGHHPQTAVVTGASPDADLFAAAVDSARQRREAGRLPSWERERTYWFSPPYQRLIGIGQCGGAALGEVDALHAELAELAKGLGGL